MTKLRELQEIKKVEKPIAKAPDRRKEFLERMKKDPDFSKYFITEIKKEMRSLDSIASLNRDVKVNNIPLEQALLIRAEKIKLLKKIFKPFLV